MIGSEKILAQKYAQAFFNAFGNHLSENDFHNACAAGAFFEQHQKALFFLKQPIIQTNIKINAIKDALSVFHLKNQFNSLINLLAAHKRLFLIMLVLEQLCELYKKHNNIMTFAISSSHALETAQLDILKQFLVNITGQTIVYEYAVDKKLIAGIRMQSSTLLWEHSISKQLASIKLSKMY